MDYNIQDETDPKVIQDHQLKQLNLPTLKLSSPTKIKPELYTGPKLQPEYKNALPVYGIKKEIIISEPK